MTGNRIHGPEAASSGNKENSSPKPGFWARWKERRRPGTVIKLLQNAMTFQNGRSAVKFDEAVSIFKELAPEQREKPLDMVWNRLADLSEVPFENDFKAHGIHVLADFLRDTSDCLPRDEKGQIAEPYKELMVYLKKVVEARDPDGNHKNHTAVRIGCVYALNELGYGDRRFWQERIMDPVTQGVAILCMLKMPPQEKPEEHGWHLLKENLDKMGIAIASHPSPKKIDFLSSLVAEDDTKSVRQGFRIAVYLGNGREHFKHIAAEMLLEESKKEFWPSAKEFIRIAGTLEKLEKGEERQKAVAKLLDQWKSGGEHLVGILNRVYSQMEKAVVEGEPEAQLDAIAALGEFSRAGIDSGAVVANIKSVVDRLLEADDEKSTGLLRKNALNIGLAIAKSRSRKKNKLIANMLIDQDPGTVINGFRLAMHVEDPPDVFSEAAVDIICDDGQQPLHAAAKEFLDIVELKDQLDMAGEIQFTAAANVIERTRAGATYLLPILLEIQENMADIFHDPPGESDEERKAAQKKAIEVIGRLATVGIATPGFDISIETAKDGEVNISVAYKAVQEAPPEMVEKVSGLLGHLQRK